MLMRTEQEYNLDYLAAALEEATATIRTRMDELSLVRRVGDAISTLTSTQGLCAELVNALAETVNCRYVSIYSGHVAAPFELQAVSSVFSAPKDFPETLAGMRVAQTLEKFQTPVQIDDVTGIPMSEGWRFPQDLVSFLFIPLVEGRNLRGVLCLSDDKPSSFDEPTLRTMMIVVPQIASAIAKIDLYDAARSSALKYRNLVESMQEVVFICDSNWRVLDVNDAGTHLFGESPAGKILPDLFSSSTTAQEFRTAVASQPAVQDFEADFVTTQGERLNTLISCRSGGNGYSGVIKDITERNRLMEQVTRAQKMESVGTLAAGVAHDFNNILAIILPNAELIKLKSADNPSATRYADVIIKASKRATVLTRQLLALGRKDARQLRQVNLNDAIGTTCRLFEDTIGKNIRVELDFASNPIHIRADDSQLEQILLNLAINARDAMPDGGSLKFHTKVDGKQVVLSVKDSGTGIPADVRGRIFDPFFTTKDKSKGTGLGLSVVYNLVKQFNGTIDVSSEVGAGTEFVLTFPACGGEGERALADRKPVGGNERILIVEDEPEMLDLMETALKSIGYSVITARNGHEAVDAVTEEIQLVITDMMMPVMDGFTAIRMIRQKFPQMKIVVASGYTTPEKLPTLRRMGVEGFVQKPFEITSLAHMVRDVLDGVTA
jgi:two-component system cell cycle sensor histidine kinase/response regulator CckA